MTIRIFTSFRFHGNLRAELDGSTGPIEMPTGRVEVVEVSEGAEHATFVRWVPAGHREAFRQGVGIANLHEDPGAVQTMLQNATSESPGVVFRIGKPGDAWAGSPARLTFSGVTALDRMSPEQKNEGLATHDMRIPCLPEHNRRGTIFSSRVVFGEAKFGGQLETKFDYAYQVVVPLPFRFGNDSSGYRDASFIMGGCHETDGADEAVHQSPREHFVWQWSQQKLLITPRTWSNEPVRFGDLQFGQKDVDDAVPPIRATHFNERPRPGDVVENLGFAGKAWDDRAPDDNKSQKLAFQADEKSPDAFKVTGRKRIAANLLKAEDQLGASYSARNKLFQLEIEASTELIDEDLANPDAAKPRYGKAKLGFRWHSKHRGLMGYASGNQHLTNDSLHLVEAGHQMRRARTALRHTREQPQSILPSLAEVNNKVFWVGLAMQVGVDVVSAPGSFPSVVPAKGSEGISPVVVTLDPTPRRDQHAARDDFPLRLKLPALDHERRGAMVHEHFHVRFVSVPDVLKQNPKTSRIVLGLDNDVETASNGHAHADEYPPFWGRLGSLHFTGVQAAPDDHAQKLLRDSAKDNPDNILELRPRGPMYPDAGNPKLDITLTLNLLLNSAEPVTTDIPHGVRDRPQEDWLIPVNRDRQVPGSDANFELETRETLLAGEDWHLEATLKEKSVSTAETAVPADAPNGAATPDAAETADIVADEQQADDVLITQAPFSMMRLRRAPLSSLGDESQSEIAIWNSDTRQWQFRQPQDLVPVSFPAGAVGESADKPGRLEIHDDPGLAGNDLATTQVKGRFSGPTTIWADVNHLGRGFGIPIHNARELFGQRSEIGPGVSLSGFVTELVYAMATSWRVPTAQGAARSPVRLAEADALMGWTLRDKPEEGEVGPITTRWPDLHRVLHSRPQHLEAVQPLQPGEASYPLARFDNGLTFAARRTAVLRPPVDGMTVPAEGADLVGPKLARHGLPGGAFWPIEQRAFLEALWRSPVSDEGSLENLAIGPFGGSGMQTARFVNGSLAIISETRMGRIESLRIEVKGRIAAFWHHAKHVVIYRRTTAQSDQFEPENNGETRSNRPILRKVQEFIEVLEPVRCFPDQSNVDARSTGFLKEVRFASARINVDSAWSENVGATGWRIPLWQRRASQLRPAVYPAPGIVFATDGDGDEAISLTLQDCLDPQKLFFFTDARLALNERDTGKWPAIVGVDNCRTQDSQEWLKVQNDITKGDRKATRTNRRPSASRFAPGLGRFTFRLSKSATLTQINAKRGDKPVFSGLDSVTFMRGSAELSKGQVLVAPTEDNLKEFNLLAENADNLAEVLSGSAPDPSTAPPAIKAVQDSLNALLAELAGSNLGNAKAAFKTYQQKIKDAETYVATASSGDLKKIDEKLFGGAGQDAFARLKDVETALTEILNFEKSDCDALKRQALTQLRAKKMLLLQNLAQVQGDLLARIEKEAKVKADLERFIEDAMEDAIKVVKRTMDRVDADVGNVLAQVEDARAGVRDWKAQVDRAFASGRTRLDEFRNSYEMDKPWSQSRFDQAQTSLLAEIANLEGEATAALTELRQRLAAEISGSAAGVTSVIDAALRRGLEQLVEQRPRGKWTHVRDALSVGINEAIAATDATSAQGKQIQDAIDKLKDLQTGLPEDEDKVAVGKLIGELEAVWTRMDDHKARFIAWAIANKDTLPEFIELSKNLPDDVAKELTSNAEAAKQKVAEFEDLAQGVLANAGDATLDLIRTGVTGLNGHVQAARDALVDLGYAEVLDQMVEDLHAWINQNATVIQDIATQGLDATDAWLAEVEETAKDAAGAFSVAIREGIAGRVINPVFDTLKARINALPEANIKEPAKELVRGLHADLTALIDDAEGALQDIVGDLEKLCQQLSTLKQQLLDAISGFRSWLQARLAAVGAALDALKVDGFGSIADLKAAFDKLDNVFDQLRDELQTAADAAVSYLTRALERAGDLVGDIGQEAADQVLRLLHASGSLPDIGNLGIDTDRLTALFDPLKDLIDLSDARALLDRFGDALSSMRLDLPFDGLADGLDLNFLDLEVPDIFGAFGGLGSTGNLLDLGSAEALKKYIKVTHDIDKKAKTAWVKAEVDVPFPGRRKMFGFGPFSMFMLSPQLTGWVRVDADANTKEVVTTDHGQIATDLEAAVTGQPLVTLRDVKILYSRDTGLDFQIDPKKIKLHPNFQFIQDFMSSLGLDGDGNGIQIIKENGIPVGVEHRFAIPPISLMYATSGVSNIRIANRFSLIAYPDFRISDTFNLSDEYQPFIFSIFIIGGTGYIELGVDYEPAENALSTRVKAAAGGSAALGFSFGPVSGGVFITLSVVMTYHKTLGGDYQDEDDGLTIALELLIAGYVSLWGIVSIYLGLLLSLSYRDNGQVDASGRLKVSVRVSRFFKLKYSTTVTYKLRDGKSTTTRSEQVGVTSNLGTVQGRSKHLNQARAILS